jgi:hypothetical protein
LLKRPVNASLPILSFWRDLEIFNIPAAPASKDATDQVKVVTLRPGDTLPWHLPEFQPTERHGYIHVVYVGVADTEHLSRLLLQAVFPDRELSERERQRASGNGWMAAFVATENGLPKLDSYLAASFAHGIDMLWHSDQLDGINARLERAREEFAQRRHKLENPSAETTKPQVPPTPLTWDDLGEELRIVQAFLGNGASAPNIDWRVVVRVSRVKRQYIETNLQAATDYLNSFYLDDLDRLIAQANKNKPFGKALSAYLGAPIPEQERTDILEQRAAMTELLGVAKLPCARWPTPAKHPLVLAQQAAVAQVLHMLGRDGGAIGVNGPPGTGKTTLLCDVIAEIITQRAKRLTTLNKPGDIFAEKREIAGKSFFPLTSAIMAGSSIVVASTNNNAVKNITQELPARKKVSGEYGPASYFDEVIREIFVAQKVLDDEEKPVDCWGLVAAALGNAGNRRAFAKGFFRDEYVEPRATPSGTETSATEFVEPAIVTIAEVEAETEASDLVPLPPSMKQLLEAATNDYARYQTEWQTAKKVLRDLLAEFEAKRAILLKAERAALRIDACRDQIAGHVAATQAITDEIRLLTDDLTTGRHAIAIQRLLVEARQATLAQLRAAGLPNLWDRFVALFGRESGRMAALRQKLEAPTQALAQASEALAELARNMALLDAKLKALQERHKTRLSEQQTLEKQYRQYEQDVQAGYALGVKHFPGARLWALPVEEQHRASVAVSPDLDTLRARIFLQALELHRLTVLANAGRFISNLRTVNGMLTGANRDKLLSEHRPLLWDAFFFIVPVVSTTLASFDRLFLGMGQETLGWLLVDEAGQATPQSVAGAIWRSRRAVLIGDPLQIEPVFTVPLDVVEDLRQRHAVHPMWSPKDESVQTLADRITGFGSWVVQTKAGTQDTERIWTGMPLRTHRRCDEPMFTVANRIAYAGQMVQGRVDADGNPVQTNFSCVLGDSAWFDVQSAQAQHPVVNDELDVLIDSLRQLQRQPAVTMPDKPGDTPKPAKIYVISPFRKVKNACAARIRKAGFKGVESGTVHTFQGKEAEIVFLVLGTAPGQAGAGARAWALDKPNLLNVAITRAKCRLYVIGNAHVWGRLDYLSELHEALPRRQPTVPAASLAAQERLPL